MDAPNVTQMLIAWRGGDQQAFEDLAPILQQELHRVAAYHMAGERQGHILRATALVNEAYVRLIEWKNVQWQNRAHFFGVCAQLMRRVLVDYARSRRYAKRGGGAISVSLDDVTPAAEDRFAALMEIDLALQRLSVINPRLAQIV